MQTGLVSSDTRIQECGDRPQSVEYQGALLGWDFVRCPIEVPLAWEL